jgi:glycogen phosphorylase
MASSIAYFSMEIGLRSEIHTYSGGLGVLAGDTLRSAAYLEPHW